MGRPYCQPSMANKRLPGCVRFLLSRHSDECGYYKWQAKAAEGFDAGNFRIDWENKRATCPAGCNSLSWTPAIDDRINEVVKIKFSMKDCQPCAFRAQR